MKLLLFLLLIPITVIPAHPKKIELIRIQYTLRFDSERKPKVGDIYKGEITLGGVVIREAEAKYEDLKHLTKDGIVVNSDGLYYNNRRVMKFGPRNPLFVMPNKFNWGNPTDYFKPR